ncbi:GIP [Symbiodinium necroappetens]|uniref:GIP protein n=1 Tax=Symbiodinium necroappetens TaxID=1628268 RepID=A0A812ZBK1_9DINO|nr:GIP [Symbiodinium necroappetens]
MDSAGSGLEPNYEAEVRQDVSGAGRVPDSTSDTAADEIRLDQQDGTSVRGTGHSVEQTSDEQAAADVLARADGLEPEYDFESAEGGVHSPERDELQQDRLLGPSGNREQYHGVREAQSHLESVRPEGISGLGQRGVEERLPGRGRDTALLNGGPRPGKGRGNPSVFSGWEEAGFTVQASQEAQGVSRIRPGGGPLGVEATRMEHLEFLVEQLLEQNAQLKHERLDAQRRGSADCDVGKGIGSRGDDGWVETREMASVEVPASVTVMVNGVPRMGIKVQRRLEIPLLQVRRLHSGGTKVPKLPPPASPPREPQRDTAVRAADLEGRQLLEEGEVTPFFNDLAPRGHEWWQRVISEAKAEYDRSELLKGLTGLPVCDTASCAVATLQKWFRHLERAKTMEISVPDSSLLLDGVDKCMKGVLQANPNLLFRIQAIRMQLQLDTTPTQEAVEEYTRTLLAEMELLSVSMPDAGNKRQRIAAVASDPGDDKGKGKKGKKGDEVLSRANEHGRRGLIDGGATACRVYHPKFGELDVDTSTGCPEVDEGVALELIDQYELYVGQHDTRGARLRCIIEDLKTKGTRDLVGLMGDGDSQADAAFSVYIARNVDDVLILRFFTLILLAFVKGDLGNQCDQEGVSLWNTPEWQVIDYIPERDFGVVAELWTEWARYLIVGVLSVPILAVDGKSVEKPCDADPDPPLSEGGVIDDAEWFASKDEFWGYNHGAQVLTRYHPVPRRQMFVPSAHEWLPFDRDWIGDIRYCVQQFQGGEPVRTTHTWKGGRGRASKYAWTGSSSFKLRGPDPTAAIGGGFSKFDGVVSIGKFENFEAG